ncbi:MAG: ATP phosphoribosyltransferase regulatory subunit [Leptospiraceae bacterium]|nr:ATP phosphoribosyltransferase regulatory subunit [Leptospiraceae bacterium]
MKKEYRTGTEIKWIPDGFHFLGPEETEKRRKLLGNLHSFFVDRGFLEVKPPGFDYSSTFYEHVSDTEKGKILKSRDLDGNEISPSLDLTIQVVKGMSGYKGKKGSSKVYYTGRIFKDAGRGLGRRREILQAGAEIIGHSNGNTFKLLLSLIDEILEKFYINRKLTIVLGNILVVSSIFDKLNFTEYQRKLLTGFIYRKDSFEITQFLKSIEISTDQIQVIVDLLLGFIPGNKVPDELKKLNQDWNLNLEETFKETEDILSYCSKMKNLDLCLDYSLVRDMDYYTGFILHGYAGSNSTPVITGGAYDILFEKFSVEPKRACGFAININIFEELLETVY